LQRARRMHMACQREAQAHYLNPQP
jgi:hypothetical protein